MRTLFLFLVLLWVVPTASASEGKDCATHYRQMPTDDRVFFAFIAENPADRTARLVYADYLEERGQPNSAFAIRAAAEIDSLPVTPENLPKIRELQERLRNLTPRALAEWSKSEIGVLLRRIGKFSSLGREGLPVLEPSSLKALLEATPEAQIAITGLSFTGLNTFHPTLAEAQKLASMNLSNVVKLDLIMGNITAEGIETLFSPPSSLGNVSTLDLSSMKHLGDRAVTALTSPQSVLKKVRELILNENDLSATGVARLVSDVSPFHTAEKLSLAGNPIGDAGVQALTANGKFSNVKDLNLKGCGMTSLGVEHVSGKNSPFTQVTSLSFAQNAVGTSGARAVSGKDSVFGNVTVLDLTGTGLGNEGLAVLVGKDSKLANVVSADLSNNPLTAAGMNRLAAKTSKWKLQELTLKHCGLATPALAALAVPNSGLSTLRTLDLAHNEISGKAVAKLFAKDSGLANLTSLNLRFNPVGNDGALLLTGKDAGLKNLKVLDLFECKIDDDGGKGFLRADSPIQNLTAIQLGANGLGKTMRLEIEAKVLAK